MMLEESYLGKLRKAVGHAPLIVPSIRAIIEDEEQRVLFIQRKDTKSWAMPAGSIELNETIYDCLVREVEEETGLIVISAQPVCMYTSPSKSITNSFSDTYQLFEIVFFVDKWKGTIKSNANETVNSKFFPIKDLPLKGNYLLSRTKHSEG